MLSSFKVPCSLWRVFAVRLLPAALPLLALGEAPFLPAVGTLLFTSVASQALGKMWTGFWPNSGSRFPDGVGCGKCDPEYCFETGCRFPDGAQPEGVSQFEASERDALSARQNCRDCVPRRLATRPKSTQRVRLGYPPRSRRRRPPALLGRGSPR